VQMIKFKDTRYKSGAWDRSFGFVWDRIPLGIVSMVNGPWLLARGSW